MERSFKKEVQALTLGEGETFRGEGILAVTKALLQSGVSYVGGYQGAPVSHLLDVLVDAEDIIGDLGVHLETCTNEASAAAMLGASSTYPLRRATFSGKNRLAGPPRFDYGRLAHPPVIYSQERLKVEQRLPAAQQFIRARKLNEVIAGDLADVGIIVLGGLTNGVLRALARLDLADLHGASRIPLYVLNVGFPLVPEELREFCAGKRAVLVVEEGSPDYIEQAVNVELRRADIATRVLGKGMLPRAGEYTSEVLLNALASFLAEVRPADIDADAIARRVKSMLAHKAAAMAAVGDIPARAPDLWTGCPGRPVFRAIK